MLGDLGGQAVGVFQGLAGALREVLQHGVCGVAGQTDSPELAPIWRPAPTPFDTEDAPGLVAATFGSVEIQAWDAPLITLPDRDAVRDFLLARFVPPDEAERLADALADRGPLPLTKRGTLVPARRTSGPHTSRNHGAVPRIPGPRTHRGSGRSA